MASRLVAAAIGVVLAVGGCTSGRHQEQARSSPPSSVAPSTTTTPTVMTAHGCSRPAGEGVFERSADGFTAVRMATTARGWAVGRGVIVGTEDGVHWSEQYSGSEAFVDLDTVDAMHAWAVGEAHLLATTDGGRHWSEVGEPTEPLQTVDFVDRNHGFGIAGFPEIKRDGGGTVPARSGTVVTTSDGGRTWQPRPAPCDAQAVCAIDKDMAWLAAGGRLYRTSNDEDYWDEILTLAQPQVPAKQLQCAGADAVWVLAIDGQGVSQHMGYIAYHSNDGGRTIRTVMVEHFTNTRGLPGPPGPGSYPGPFSALGPSDAVFVGFTPPLEEPTSTMTVTSGGEMLGPERPVPVKGFIPHSVSYLTTTKGWIVGSTLSTDDPDPGVIIATADGGHTWQTQLRTDR